MGMDVYGKKPTTEEGKYFRNNVWWWHPLANYIIAAAPEIAERCKLWHTNDGDGLDAADAVRLADVLQREIDAGRTLAYARRYTSDLERMPNEKCGICSGTGTRLPVPQVGAGDPTTTGIKCNSCDGTGYVRSLATNYPFAVDNVREFITFLRGCGGFRIC